MKNTHYYGRFGSPDTHLISKRREVAKRLHGNLEALSDLGVEAQRLVFKIENQ